jgi:ABC-type glycerol-3-phosphate transport system substrate-binding protein
MRALVGVAWILAITGVACSPNSVTSPAEPLPSSKNSAPLPTTTTNLPVTVTGTTSAKSNPADESAECPLGSLAEADPPVEVTFWYAETGLSGDAIAALVDEFNATHVTIRVKALKQDALDTFASAMNRGELPDLIEASNTNFMQQAIDSAAVLPVEACLAADGAALYLIDGEDPAHVEAAYRFALWLSEPAQRATLHLQTGSVPVRRSVADRLEVRAWWAAYPYFKVPFADLSAPGEPPGGGSAIFGPSLVVNEVIANGWLAATRLGSDPAVALSTTVAGVRSALDRSPDPLQLVPVGPLGHARSLPRFAVGA